MSTTQDTMARPTYQQDWRAYNAAQTHEKQARGRPSARAVRQDRSADPGSRGRPRIPLSDALFAATMKVYSTTSGRRAMTDMKRLSAAPDTWIRRLRTTAFSTLWRALY